LTDRSTVCAQDYLEFDSACRSTDRLTEDCVCSLFGIAVDWKIPTVKNLTVGGRPTGRLIG